MITVIALFCSLGYLQAGNEQDGVKESFQEAFRSGEHWLSPALLTRSTLLSPVLAPQPWHPVTSWVMNAEDVPTPAGQW